MSTSPKQPKMVWVHRWRPQMLLLPRPLTADGIIKAAPWTLFRQCAPASGHLSKCIFLFHQCGGSGGEINANHAAIAAVDELLISHSRHITDASSLQLQIKLFFLLKYYSKCRKASIQTSSEAHVAKLGADVADRCTREKIFIGKILVDWNTCKW